ncbi:BshB3 potential contributor to bacillithiol synthesis [Halalkalibacter flavus]|jgi:heme/copper-type cytochrome/quinol oxidase subunit 2|uniref:BshB3 potential contributor to bacillithiol synthesis n=1 Tax=Halalkalibacter flavus TaxID=3090668 RepID=UPI002FCB2182
MTFLIILVAIVCIAALVITLSLTRAEDSNYSSNRSINNQLIMYLALIPIIAVILVLAWVFVM